MPEDLNTTIVPYIDAIHRSQVIALWESVFNYQTTHNKPDLVIDKKIDVDDQLFFVAVDGIAVVGTIMAGYDGHRGWINYLAVHPKQQRSGIGRRMMEEAERRLRAAGCPKINLQVRSTNTKVIEFYKKIGFKVDDVVSLGKRLEPDE